MQFEFARINTTYGMMVVIRFFNEMGAFLFQIALAEDQAKEFISSINDALSS